MSSVISGVGRARVAPQLEARLLGTVEVIHEGRRLRAFDAPRLQRLLGLLVLRSDLQHRARLAFALWPDSDESQARTNLRKLLHDLRQALPHSEAFVEIDHEVIRWIASGPAAVDVLEFRGALANGDLPLAGRLYGGDLLPACYDDWVLEERARLRSEAHRAHLTLAQAAAVEDDQEAAIRHSERAIRLEPTDEAAVRIQMEARLALDGRAAALRAYHRHAEALERDLGVTPGDEITTLYRRLRHDLPAGREVQASRALLVGRDQELHRLGGAWALAREGHARFVLISGEPGIGKTRLASELADRLRAEGHAVASTRAYEAAGRLPWGPIVDLLRSEVFRSRSEALDPAWKAELARLLPEIGDAPPEAEAVGDGDATDRHRLFDAVARALLDEDRACLLVIDDLQWCDAETIELIGFLLRTAPTAPLLVVGTARQEEVPDDHPLNALLGALARDEKVDMLALDRLDEASTAALAGRLGATDMIGADRAAGLWSETEGNPLFVIETVRAGASTDVGRPVLTPTMRAVLAGRLANLSPGARDLAEVAAVIGRSFSLSLIVTATGIAEQDLVDHLDELWRRRIVRDQGVTYDFTHDKLRAVALELASPARRRRLHRAVAEALADQHREDLDAVAARLAAHYDAAGLVEPAIDAYRRAGQRAVAVSALGEAVGAYRRAIGLLSELPPSPERDLHELDLRIFLGSPLVALEGYGSRGTHQLYERSLALCRRLGRRADPPILRGLGLARLQGCRFSEAADFGRALLDHDGDDPVTTTEGRYLMGVSAFWQGELAAAEHHLEAALARYDEARRPEHLTRYAQDPHAVCLVRLGWSLLWAGDADRAADAADAALQLATDLDHTMTLAYVITYGAIIAAESGDRDRLGELLERAERLRERSSERYLMIVLDALRGWTDVREGSPEGVEAIVRCVARSRAEGETLHLTYTLLLLARARHLLGEFAAGRAATREALDWTDLHDQRYLEPELWRIDGELAYRSGEPDEAAHSLDNAVRVAAHQGAGWFELRAAVSLGQRFPDQHTLGRLRDLVGAIPSGHDLPAVRAATELLGDPG